MPSTLSTRHPANTNAEILLIESSTHAHNRRGMANGYAKELWPGFWQLLKHWKSQLKVGSVVIGKPANYCEQCKNTRKVTRTQTNEKTGEWESTTTMCYACMQDKPGPPHLACMILYSPVTDPCKGDRIDKIIHTALKHCWHQGYKTVSLPFTGKSSLPYSYDIQRQMVHAINYWEALPDNKHQLILHSFESSFTDKPDPSRAWDGEWELLTIIDPIFPDLLQQQMFEEQDERKPTTPEPAAHCPLSPCTSTETLQSATPDLQEDESHGATSHR